MTAYTEVVMKNNPAKIELCQSALPNMIKLLPENISITTQVRSTANFWMNDWEQLIKFLDS